MSGALRVLMAALVASLFSLAPARAQVSEFEGLDDAQLDEAIDFVLGNALFVLMHEAGHMLVSELGLPVLGREEDAVDSLSALIMLEADDEVFDNALINASDGWFMSGEAAEAAGHEYSFWGEHSVDEQRGYAIVCLMVGQNPQKFGDLVAAQEIPQQRRERCASDYRQVSESWFQLLTPHMRSDDGENAIDIVYDDPASAELEIYAVMFREGDLLTVLKKLIADMFALDEGITFRATSCGQANAFWDPSKRQIIFCYELSQFHARLIGDYYRAGGQ